MRKKRPPGVQRYWCLQRCHPRNHIIWHALVAFCEKPAFHKPAYPINMYICEDAWFINETKISCCYSCIKLCCVLLPPPSSILAKYLPMTLSYIPAYILCFKSWGNQWRQWSNSWSTKFAVEAQNSQLQSWCISIKCWMFPDDHVTVRTCHNQWLNECFWLRVAPPLTSHSDRQCSTLIYGASWYESCKLYTLLWWIRVDDHAMRHLSISSMHGTQWSQVVQSMTNTSRDWWSQLIRLCITSS